MNIYDLLVIGGGINGTAVAEDAAGRGLSVVLCEKNDLASGTSSKSSKLIHGGIRYLEQYKFKLVHEALTERAILMYRAPFLVHPLEFILPYEKHLRPKWMIRAGLFLYDHLTTHRSVPTSKYLKLDSSSPLKNEYSIGFGYYDCVTDDSRLTVLNALSAKQHGATILTRHHVTNITTEDKHWVVQLNGKKLIYCKAIVDASGAWINKKVINVKGSHIVVPKLYNDANAYILQNKDKRIVFTIPYQNNFTLIGTTDEHYSGDLDNVKISSDETSYLINICNHYFEKKIKPSDVVWSFAGLRSLIQENTEKLSAISRELKIELVLTDELPTINLYGGKLTTHRSTAEKVMKTLKPFFPSMKKSWTSSTTLPGGNMNNLNTFLSNQVQRYAWLDKNIVSRYVLSYGTEIHNLLSHKKNINDLGKHFGYGLFEHEVEYLLQNEWASTAEDILWRRSKLGLYFSNQENEVLNNFITK